jgi:hypothetical protein
MKPHYFHPAWLSTLNERQRRFALDMGGRGMHFCHKFLFKKGHHLFIIGATLSGKTQKAYWVVEWIIRTQETVIWIDSAKNRELIPLLTMGKPVRIICPVGCDVEFIEWSDDEHKYVRMKNHPEVIHVSNAGGAWWAVKKGMINIFCFRNAFESQKEARVWMKELFETLSHWTRKNLMPPIFPIALFGDESHWFLAGEKLTSDPERNRLSELITELSLEDRAYKIRLVLMAQSYKGLPPASRENMICNLLCRGAKVSPDENNTLSVYNSYTSTYSPKEGVFVYEGGFTCPRNENRVGYPWPFHFYPMPKIKVNYIGEFDVKTPAALAEQEIEQEMMPDIGKYQAQLYDLEGFEVPANTNRYEVIPDDST